MYGSDLNSNHFSDTKILVSLDGSTVVKNRVKDRDLVLLTYLSVQFVGVCKFDVTIVVPDGNFDRIDVFLKRKNDFFRLFVIWLKSMCITNQFGGGIKWFHSDRGGGESANSHTAVQFSVFCESEGLPSISYPVKMGVRLFNLETRRSKNAVSPLIELSGLNNVVGPAATPSSASQGTGINGVGVSRVSNATADQVPRQVIDHDAASASSDPPSNTNRGHDAQK
jgi:hypothetical protein